MKFFVYCNIKKRTLSVKALEGEFKGLVVAGVEQILIGDAQLKVSEAGRQRVLKSQRKNVHAGVVGQVKALWGASVREDLDPETFAALVPGLPWPQFRGTPLTYNPYKTRTFVRKADGRPVVGARLVKLDRCRIWAKGIS